MFLITKAKLDDFDNIFKIYTDAVEKFAKEETYQWVKGYPNKEIFLNDINNHEVFIVKKEEEIIGVMTFIQDEEIDYKEIDGNWLNNESYAVIHRIAVKKEYLKCGIGSLLIDYAVSYTKDLGLRNIRIDTHKDNHDMKKLLERKGFIKCGVIKLHTKNFELRDAYQLLCEK